MSLLTRLSKLEESLRPQTSKSYWLMWKDCEWREADGIVRMQDESIEDFKERVLAITDKQYIWVR